MYQATIIKLDFDLCEECETCPCLCNEDQEENCRCANLFCELYFYEITCPSIRRCRCGTVQIIDLCK